MAIMRSQFSAENPPETAIPSLLHTMRKGETDLWSKKNFNTFFMFKNPTHYTTTVNNNTIIYHYDTAVYNVPTRNYCCFTVKILKQITKIW